MLQGLTQPFQHFSEKVENSTAKVSVVSAITNMPGMTNLIAAPFEAGATIKKIRNAHRIRDIEACIDAVVRMISVPFMALNGFGIAHDTLIEIHILRPTALATASLIGSIAGIVICALDLIIESVNFFEVTWFGSQINKDLLGECLTMLDKPQKTQIKFLHKVATHVLANRAAYVEIFDEDTYDLFANGIRQRVEKLKKDGDLQQPLHEFRALLIGVSLAYVEAKYLQLSPGEMSKVKEEILRKNPTIEKDAFNILFENEKKQLLSGKKSMLSRRVSVWMVDKLNTEIIPILKKLASDTPVEIEKAVKNAEVLIKQLHMQVDKKKLIHMAGIISLIFFIVALSIPTAGIPFAALLALNSAPFIFATLRYILYKGLLKSQTWAIEWERVPPRWFKSMIQRIWKPQEIEATTNSVELSLSDIPRSITNNQTENDTQKRLPYLDTYEHWKRLDRRIQAYI